MWIRPCLHGLPIPFAALLVLGLAACDDSLRMTPDATSGDIGVQKDGKIADGPLADQNVRPDRPLPTPDGPLPPPPDGPLPPPPDGPLPPPPDGLLPPPDTGPDQCVKLTEVCDDKDNNCNSKIDETFPSKGVACAAGNGVCAATGKMVCDPLNASRLVCDAKVGAAGVEACRTGKDEDCDKLTDEICGPLHGYAIVDANGGTSKARDLKSARLAQGSYLVTPTGSTNQGCWRPLLISTVGAALPHTVDCPVGAAASYVVSTAGGTAGGLDTAFHAVQPASTANEVWGVVSDTSCINGFCKLSAERGKPSVRLLSTSGVFEIHHSACGAVHQPVFATIRGLQPGWAIGSSNGTVCQVRTYDAFGKQKVLPFQFWLPDSPNNAWAEGSWMGKLAAGNNFNDQNAKWAISKVSLPPPSSLYLRFRTTFLALANPSAVLATGRLSSSLISTAIAIPNPFVVNVVTYANGKPAPLPFFVLYVQ